MTKPKILVFDIETSPILGHVWGLFDQNIGLNMVKADWHVIAWAAKWLGAPAKSIMYQDQRNAKKIEDDSKILKKIWQLLDEADIVVTQNGRSFDQKKLNARFILNGMQPPSSYKHIDTRLLAKKHFAFTSNKLEYMTDKLCVKYKKIKHSKFGGFDLWKECLAGNLKAWKEMEKYNKYDVLSLEELYTKLIPWDSAVNFSLYNDESMDHTCTCGSSAIKNNGYAYTSTGKFQRYKCTDCGAEVRSRQNCFSKVKTASLKTGTKR